MNPSSSLKRESAIALLGGAFDPIHVGHLAIARAACRRFHLDAVHFIASARPPHKPAGELTPFAHRYAMVALACAGERRFIPSLAEADASGSNEFFYTIDTVRRIERQLAGTATRLYFITGADAFLQIQTWKNFRSLLEACDFIVAHRPGFGIRALAEVIPPDLLSPSEERGSASDKAPRAPARDSIALRNTTVHLLKAVSSGVSSTEIRRRCRHHVSIRGQVPAGVADYIEKQALYRS